MLKTSEIDLCHNVRHARTCHNLLVASSHSIIWFYQRNVDDYALLSRHHEHMDTILYLEFSHDGAQIVTAAKDCLIIVWNVAARTVKFVLDGHTNLISGVAWLFDNVRIASISYDKTAMLWSSATGQLLRIFRGNLASVSSVSISAGDQYIATGCLYGTVQLWQPDSVIERVCLRVHTWPINSVACHPENSKLLLSSCCKLIVAHDVSVQTILFRLDACDSKLYWLPHSRCFISGLPVSVITIWNFDSRTAVLSLDDLCYIQDLQISRDGQHLVLTDCSHTIKTLCLPWHVCVDPDTLCAADVNNRALLQSALLLPHDDVLSFNTLLQIHGVDVNAVDADGDTALHVAMHLQRLQAIDALKAAGADAMITNAAGRIACAPVHIYDLLPPELWAIVICDFCDLRTMQQFSYTCHDARHLLTADSGGYAHRVSAERKGMKN